MNSKMPTMVILLTYNGFTTYFGFVLQVKNLREVIQLLFLTFHNAGDNFQFDNEHIF